MKIPRLPAIYLAWVLCLAGSLMSLYFSELRHIEPCRFCWFQRIALFPLAIQLGIFTYRSDGSAAIYGIPLCFVGFSAAVLQSLDLVFDFHALCGPGISCREGMIYFFDFIPLCWVSGAGFVVIAALLWLGRRVQPT
ncbi:MAG: disulfide oxidoreductase [Parachlamydiales bacterium]|nr:disulfide oxidoreductase [Parachlamydiales bacterium]